MCLNSPVEFILQYFKWISEIKMSGFKDERCLQLYDIYYAESSMRCCSSVVKEDVPFFVFFHACRRV